MPEDLSPGPTSHSSRPVVVLGAGIVGLATALRILQHPKQLGEVHVVAAHLPGDPLSAEYASPAAGAHHLSFAADSDERQQGWDRRTFQIMMDEWSSLGEASGLMRIRQTEYYDGNEKHLQILEEHPDFVEHPASTLPAFASHSVSFTSLTINPVLYLRHVLSAILAFPNAHVHRHHVASLSDLVSSPAVLAVLSNIPPSAIVNCTGIGALSLGGVADETVFPTRGQVVQLRAPWLREGFTRQIGKLDGGEGGERTYVIPRHNGEVIVGGTREINDWYPYPREETTLSILTRALEICPALLPPHLASSTVSSQRSGALLLPLVEKVIVGFRPSRTAGIRLERGEDLAFEHGGEACSARVVHQYGHGGAGWQSSWGTAESAVELLFA